MFTNGRIVVVRAADYMLIQINLNKDKSNDTKIE